LIRDTLSVITPLKGEKMNVETILAIVAALIGVPALWALVIDVGKWAGWITDGNAGKVSAVCNLITILVVAAVMQFWPIINIAGIDAQLLEIVKFMALIFGLLQQIITTKAAHLLYTRVFKIKAFTLTHA
jgi:hypothetical protein